MTAVIAVLTMAVGLFLILRAAAIVATGTAGRFPLDPWLSLLAGFGLIILGRGVLG